MNESVEFDPDSTLVRHGATAATFSEMARFAEEIETRPLDKLLLELPSLVMLSESKFNIARSVIRRRARELPEVEREQLQAFADEAAEVGGPAADRIRTIFA
jgi:hypothetical protein